MADIVQTAEAAVVVPDPFDARRAQTADGLLAAFNAAGVLAAADVHVARRLGVIAGEKADDVLLAVALAVRGPRLGHVYVDLATIATTATVESDMPVDLSELAWPHPEAWIAAVAGSALVRDGEDEGAGARAGAEARPLRLVGSHLYLDRYWREELRVAEDLVAFAAHPAEGVDVDVLSAGLARLFPGEEGAGRQALAAATAVLRRFTVVAGGPGTGKTTTVARIVALLLEQASAAGAGPPLIALAAPTGKAAARLEEAVHEQAAGLKVADSIRAALVELDAGTLHRLLGWRPDSHSRFRHHRGNRLPHDIVIVDETSMVSLSLMGRLVESVRPDARLILVGDPGQLTSIEAGAVLGDVVGPAADGLLMRPGARAALEAATGQKVQAADPPAGSVVGDGIVVLNRVHRFHGGIAKLAEAIRRGDGDEVMQVLSAGHDDVVWIDADPAEATAAQLEPVRAAAVKAGAAVIHAAQAGDAVGALQALGSFRLLCAHRRGPHGASHWMARVERWLTDEIDDFEPRGPWYAGRPLLVTENDYSLKLYNGDTGVVVTAPTGRLTAAFERRGTVVHLSPARLCAVDTVHAMTVHKAQGSQFKTAAVLLPPADSPILTRELLYTAVTRASERLVVMGTREAVRETVDRPATRASGLGERLWIAP
jgi:exodeoxyribonuclease V alpha subunit